MALKALMAQASRTSSKFELAWAGGYQQMDNNMTRFDDPSDQDRILELASILAIGVLRLHNRAALMPNCGQDGNCKTPETSAEVSLELPDKTVLSVHTGKRFPRPTKRTTR